MPADRPRSVFLTGASSGIGAALARYYAARGVTLGLVARRAGALDRLVAELGIPCAVYAVDVRDAERLRQAAGDFVARHGCPDVVIANAGVSVGTLTEHVEDGTAFDEVLATNVIGMVNTFRPFIAAMRDAGTGSLAGIASVAGYRGLPGAGAYSASKAAAISYLESLRVEMSGSGVRVVTICPGYIATPMTDKNPYRMPFLMTAEEAAAKIAGIIARGTSFAVIPWQMAVVAKLLRVLPNWAYDRLFRGAARKPRRRPVIRDS